MFRFLSDTKNPLWISLTCGREKAEAARFDASVRTITPLLFKRRATGLTRDSSFTFDIQHVNEALSNSPPSAAPLVITLFGKRVVHFSFFFSFSTSSFSFSLTLPTPPPTPPSNPRHFSLRSYTTVLFCKWLHPKSSGKKKFCSRSCSTKAPSANSVALHSSPRRVSVRGAIRLRPIQFQPG